MPLCESIYAADELLHLLHLVQSIERMMRKRQVRVGHQHVLARILVQQVQQQRHTIAHRTQVDVFSAKDLKIFRIDDQRHSICLSTRPGGP